MNILVNNCKNELLIFFQSKFNRICIVVMLLASVVFCGWMKIEEQRFPEELKGDLSDKVKLVYSVYDGFQMDLEKTGEKNIDFDLVQDYYYEYSYFFGDLFFRDLSDDEILQGIIDLLNQEEKIKHVDMLAGVGLTDEERRMWLNHITALKENGLMVIDEEHHFSSYNGVVQLHKQGLIVIWFIGIGLMLVQMFLKDKQNHVERVIYTSPYPRRMFLVSKSIACFIGSLIVLFGILLFSFMLYGIVNGFENQEYLIYTLNGHVRLDRLMIRCLLLDIGSILLLNLTVTSGCLFIKDLKKGLFMLFVVLFGCWLLTNVLPFPNVFQFFLPYSIAESFDVIVLVSCIISLIGIFLLFIFCCYRFEKKDLY